MSPKPSLNSHLEMSLKMMNKSLVLLRTSLQETYIEGVICRLIQISSKRRWRKFTGPISQRVSLSTPKMRSLKFLRRKISGRRIERRLRNLICRKETLALASLTKTFKGPILNQAIS
jgi:hypothetical protein